MNKASTFTLQEISLWDEKEKVSLPAVQRGFVWKPSQIEDLWDSLLRGYPVGAFVLSPKRSSDTFEMLDGQQRATAICLGFGKETFRDSQNKIKVFIDLEKPKGEDNRKYIFRVITKSHPWGYQRTDNTKTLTSDNIRKAMTLYGLEDYLESNLNDFFPFDASIPIPLHFFITASLNNNNEEQLINNIKEWSNWTKILDRWNEDLEKIEKINIENGESKRELPELSNEEKIYSRVKEIYKAVKIMLDFEYGQKIPALYLDLRNELDETTLDILESIRKNTHEDESEENEQPVDQIENLFIRLNSGGTPLRGEELNYSILKSNIDPKLQKEIEDACEGLFIPSRFITIAYRLFQHRKELLQRDALTMRIKPKQFQKTVNENSSLLEFSDFLKNTFERTEYNGKTLLQYTKYLLEYDENINKHGLPYLIISKIADDAPEVMFMLLYRLLIKKDLFDLGTSLHRKMIGVVTLFMWLGKGQGQRDHSKLISNIWPSAKLFHSELFWSSSTVQRAMLNEILTPFPPFDKKYDKSSLIKIKKYSIRSDSDLRDKFENNNNDSNFLNLIWKNRDLILYAQRHFLSKFFKVKQYHLDDTNRPFDWDHISPHKLISKKKGIPNIIGLTQKRA